MAIDAINGIAVDTDAVINGISGIDEVSGFALVSGGTAPTDYVLQWRFNGDLLDTSAGGIYPGSAVGTEAYGIGQDTVADHAFAFNGSSYINRGGFLDFTTQDFSFSFWVFVNTGALANDPVLVWKGPYQTSGYYGGLAADGRVYFGTHQPGADQTSQTSAGSITENSWHNIIVTRAGASVKIYVNGTNATSTSASHVNPASSAGEGLLAGSYQGASNYLTGRMDDFRVYDYELTSGQASAIDAAGAE